MYCTNTTVCGPGLEVSLREEKYQYVLNKSSPFDSSGSTGGNILYTALKWRILERWWNARPRTWQRCVLCVLARLTGTQRVWQLSVCLDKTRAALICPHGCHLTLRLCLCVLIRSWLAVLRLMQISKFPPAQDRIGSLKVQRVDMWNYSQRSKNCECILRVPWNEGCI